VSETILQALGQTCPEQGEGGEGGGGGGSTSEICEKAMHHKNRRKCGKNLNIHTEKILRE